MFRILRPCSRNSVLNKRTFYEERKSGYPILYTKPPENLTFFQKLRQAMYEFKDEFKLFIHEQRTAYKLFPVMPAPNEHDIVWKFDGTQKSLDYWVVNCDSDYHHGYSTAKLELSPRGTGIFHGILDTRVAKDGRTMKSGYCNITSAPKFKSFRRKDNHDWSDYNELILRIRGDGRCYMLNILQIGYLDQTWNNCHQYLMYTRGGPYWETIKIPFSKFAYSKKGELQEIQYSLPETDITNFGITIADRKPGPFKLEIDYIAVCHNPFISEKFAYEMYKMVRKSE